MALEAKIESVCNRILVENDRNFTCSTASHGTDEWNSDRCQPNSNQKLTVVRRDIESHRTVVSFWPKMVRISFAASPTATLASEIMIIFQSEFDHFYQNPTIFDRNLIIFNQNPIVSSRNPTIFDRDSIKMWLEFDQNLTKIQSESDQNSIGIRPDYDQFLVRIWLVRAVPSSRSKIFVILSVIFIRDYVRLCAMPRSLSRASFLYTIVCDCVRCHDRIPIAIRSAPMVHSSLAWWTLCAHMRCTEMSAQDITFVPLKFREGWYKIFKKPHKQEIENSWIALVGVARDKLYTWKWRMTYGTDYELIVSKGLKYWCNHL